jgi:hypothetical protein
MESWANNPATKASGEGESDIIPVLRGMAQHKYATRPEQYIFDKSRGWLSPAVFKTMIGVQGDAKIIATVRPIGDCLASFVKIAAPDDVRDFCKNSHLAAYLFSTYTGLKDVYKAYSDKVLFVEYDDLVRSPATQLDRISDFIGADKFNSHDFANVESPGEVDKAWDIDGLHDVRPVVGKQEYSAREILGDELFDFYQGGEFWNDTPEPDRGVDPLNIQLDASIHGDFKTSEELIKDLRVTRPDCNRVAFNAGWFAMKNGNLQEGYRLLDQGREESVFGNFFGSSQPKWGGQKSTVLLHLEGGLGDQIHAFRYASHINELAQQVIVSCSSELAPMFAESFPVVQHEAALGAYHDHWVPGMSAVRHFSYEWPEIDGTPYISCTSDPVPGRVGVRWAGNPQFEHEQHRLFPEELLFDAVKGFNCVSLQRDEGADLKPNWMLQADVSDWAATRKSIGECEIVITSCTSIAHLAGAMGIEVWIILPILPYYLWALPGNKSPYYDSVTLFRQEKYGDWSDPFKNIKEQLKCMHTLKTAA